jgi:hypothetical protein
MSDHKLAIAAAIAVLTCPGLVAAAPAAAGTELCVPQALGVPGDVSPLPEWWNPAVTTKEQRWTGATRSETPSISAGTPMAWSRVIWDRASHTAFFHYTVKSDPSINADLDHVVMVLSDAAGQPALFVQLDPWNACVDAASPDGIADACEAAGAAIPTVGVKYATPESPTSADNWTNVSTTNPLASFSVARPWVIAGRRNVGSPTAPMYVFDWEVQLAVQIPVDASGEAGASARLFASVLVQAGSATGGNNLQFPVFCNASSPTSLMSCQVTGTTDNARADGIPDVLARWEPLKTSQQCAGVSIDRMNVGSDHNPTTGTLDGVPYVFPGNEIPRTSGAHLRAGIRNGMGRTLQPGEVTARFRIAGWGATFSDATWQEVGTASLVGSLGGVDTTHPSGQVAYMPGQGTLGMTSLYAPGSSIVYDHQCVHVQLEGHAAAGQELRFANDSVYRNMDLVPASMFRRNAEINLAGMPEPEVPRRVLLLVDTRDMPAPGQCWVMPEHDDVPQFSRAFGCWEPDQQMVPPRLATEENKRDGVDSPERLPTWAAHAFVETGATVESEGVANPIWLPFSGWGYYVQHSGQVTGWEHRLHGAQHLADAPHNIYMIETPPNRIVTVATTIRTVDAANPPCPAAGTAGPLPDGCDEPQLPPPRAAPGGTKPGGGGGGGCCAASSKGQGTAQGMIMFGILLGLRRARRRR